MSKLEIDQQAYQSLRKVAAYYLSNERVNHTLCPTSLVNEAYLKFNQFSQRSDIPVSFMAVAARNMRQILVDHALARNAAKRNAGERLHIVIDEHIAGPAVDLDILELNDSLERLAREDALKAQIIELRYFSGMTYAEIAVEVSLPVTTVKRKWTAACAWMYRDMS